ncbi:toll/interleukin-1 receptor domain-containing protein [Duganella qianjiadongensis]|uniref:toll/interleukin-1 receptor domain-containing protein n=1 Tax=Duganella qianjiadongensis TaxID=2692176 RepID=UPI001E364830|nr:toll/interleukin-1 receptor domain-containing protein [Duganella qianjiadongensis]
MGAPTVEQIAKFQELLQAACSQFQLELGQDIALTIQPEEFRPDSRAAAAAIFFGGINSVNLDIAKVIDFDAMTVLPIASSDAAVMTEIPPPLRRLNCLFADKVTPERIFHALLECVGLLPRQRRVFISYRRNEATPSAVQLFAELSSRQFEVFLDTQGIGPAVDFQETLWHQLCDVDVLVMLETPGYFESRWTSAEYGRALAKGIGVLRIQWPDTTPSIHTGTASLVEVVPEELDVVGQFAQSAIDRICSQLEDVRSLSHATRHLSMVTAVQDAVQQVEGKFDGIGANRTLHLTLRSGRKLMVQPTIGVPTSTILQETFERAGPDESAIVYDHFGLKRSWQSHMNWLAQKVPGARWIKKTDAAWDLGGWEAT